MSSKKASSNPGLCPVKGQKPGLGTQTGSRNEFSRLSLGVTKTCNVVIVVEDAKIIVRF